MRCNSCGASLTNEKFCPYCGVKIVNENVKVEKERKRQGIPIVVIEDDGEYSMYYPSCIDTESYENINECKEEARMLLDENFGDYSPLTEEKLLNDRYTKKLIKKGINASIGFLEVNIDKLTAEYEDSLNDSYDGENFDNSSSFFENSNFGLNRRRGCHDYNDEDVDYGITGVYAYIEKNGLFYEGDIPGLSFCKENFCHSYDECIRKLQKNYAENKNRAFFEYPNQNLNKIKREHPKAKIIRLD